jgi:polyhydroxybutyrate depolymerase
VPGVTNRPISRICLAAGAAALLSGCGASNSDPAPSDRSPSATVTVAPDNPSTATAPTGLRPPPIVHLPPRWSAAQRLPLVVALHASGGTPAGFEANSGWDEVADEHDFIVAYLGSPSPAWKSPSNVAYIGAQIRRIAAKYRVDRNRVYVTGFSAGAYISYFVGCRLSAIVAGIAPVSGGMLRQPCTLARPISVLTIIGTHDIIPLAGTRKFPAPATVTALWRKLDHCGGGAPSVSTAGPVTERIWRACARGRTVGLYVLSGGRHEYPGAPGLPNADPDSQYRASQAIWEFFARNLPRG